MQCYRERQLEPPCEEEEIEEIEEHEEPDQPMESEKVTDSSQKDTDADKETDGDDKEKDDGNESDGSKKSGRTSRSRSRSGSSKCGKIALLNSIVQKARINILLFVLQEHPAHAHVHTLDREVGVPHRIKVVRAEVAVVSGEN